MNVYELNGVSFQYKASTSKSLKNIDLKIEEGKCYALIGKNDAGKTTLCSYLRGFGHYHYRGVVEGTTLINGVNIDDMSLADLSDKIGYVFQNPFTQISSAKDTVFEEIAYALENLGRDPEEIIPRVEELLELLNINHLRDKNPVELSGGQKQKVAIASIIAFDPPIYIFDEPTSQLDPEATEEIFEIIKYLKSLGKTIILVEHKVELIAKYADNIILMDNGEIIEHDNCYNVLTGEKIIELNIAPPEYVLLFRELQTHGINVERFPLTEGEAIIELKKYGKELKCHI